MNDDVQSPESEKTKDAQQATDPVFPDDSRVAATDDESFDSSVNEDNELRDIGKKTNRSKFGWLENLKPSWPPTKKQLGIYASILIIIFGAITGYVYSHRGVTVLGNHILIHKPKPKSKLVPSTLTGLPVDPSVNQRPVTAVMIENSPDARPQSSLDKAGVVFEALAEGGVTRFMAVFQDTQPDYIGPVRSARPYYVQWALGFDAGYAHVGGSPDGLSLIRSAGARDLDQFYNDGAYQRISSRYAPHNVYTSISSLNQLEQSKGWGSSKFTGFNRKAEKPYKAPVAATPGKPAPKNQDTRTPVTSIDFSFSGAYYDPHFDYVAKTNSYNRSEAGAPHMEVDKAGNQTQISPKVVIAIVVPESQGALDASGAYYSDYNPIGSGPTYIFQDGVVTTGTWNKAGNTSQITFTDAAGKPIGLNPGQTWISAVTSTSSVSYK